MPMRRRPKPKRDPRIDVAMDHLAQQGFAKPQIYFAIKDLLKVYGRNGWPFLQEESYQIVRNKILEEQALKYQKQEAAAAKGASPQYGMEVSGVNGEAPNESQ